MGKKGVKLWRASCFGREGSRLGQGAAHTLVKASGAGGEGHALRRNPRQHPALRGVPASGSTLPFPESGVLGADFTGCPEPVSTLEVRE